MKCQKCGGNAELSNWGSIIDIDYADYHVECEKGGIVEWLKQPNTTIKE